MRIGAQRRDLHEAPHPGFLGGGGDVGGAFDMHALERAPAPFEQNADEIDYRVGSRHRRPDQHPIRNVGRPGDDLTDVSERLEITGSLRIAHRDANDAALGRQAPDQMSPKEPRSAEHGDDARIHGDLLFLEIGFHRAALETPPRIGRDLLDYNALANGVNR